MAYLKAGTRSSATNRIGAIAAPPTQKAADYILS
jgi:hypothetical protein